MNDKLSVGLAHGDINGINYEIIIKILAENRLCEVCSPVVIGSSKVAGYYRKMFDTAENPQNISLNLIQRPSDASDKRSNIINCTSDEIRVDTGIETRESDEAAMLALRQGFDYLDGHALDALVAAPMGDYAFDLERTTSMLHYLSARYESDFLLPLYVGSHMKLAFLSSGKSLKEALGMMTVPAVVRRLKMLNRALMRDFALDKPKIAVLALNESTGDGIFGAEEENVIKPAIENVRNEGIMAVGPYAADRFFQGGYYRDFDAVLALHRDQGMIPFKSVEGLSGAVLVSGLPSVFTTTVHGMAYDIAGKGVADESSLRDAVYLAIDVYRNRAMYSELTSNTLRSYDVGGDRRESDLNVEQIAGVESDGRH